MPLARVTLPGGGYRDQLIQDAVSRFVRNLSEELILSYGTPTPLIYTNYSARLGDMVRVDPTSGALTVILPAVNRSDEGKAISIVNVGTSTNTVTITPQAGTINGYTSIDVAKASFLRQAVVTNGDTNQWKLSAVLDGNTSAAKSPWFEWNALDATQFDSIVYNTFATSSAVASVQAAAGVNWLQIAITSNGSSGAYDRNHQAILPITQAPPSANYFIRADCYVSTLAASNRFDAGFVLRWTTGTPSMGDGYCIQRQNSTGGIEIKRWNDAVSGNYGTETALRTVAQNDANDQTTDAFTIGGEVSGGTILMCNHEGLTYGHVETAGTFTAAGQACIMAGIGSGHAGSASATVRFRNIRAYASPMETV